MKLLSNHLITFTALSLLFACGPTQTSEVECTLGTDCASGVCDRFAGKCLSGEDDAPKEAGDRCGEDACPDGLECVDNPSGSICMATCEVPGERCESGELCLETSQGINICYIDGSSDGACEGDAQCSEGEACAAAPDGEGGVCVTTCDAPGGVCEDGAVCLDTAGVAICLPGGPVARGGECDSPLDCALGSRCVGAGAVNVCVDACEEDSGCRPGARCLALEGAEGSVCRPGIGASCASDADCPDALSCSAAFEDAAAWEETFPLGYCTARDCSEGSCPEGSVCATPGALAPTCVATCEADIDCRFQQGWRCLSASDCQGAGCEAFFGSERLCMTPEALATLEN